MDQSEDGDGMSDEGAASLVGFGEGASSTVSGPIYTRSNVRLSQVQAPPPGTPSSAATAGALEQRRDAQMTDAVAEDTESGFVDTTIKSPVPAGTPVQGGGREAAERIVRDRLDGGEGRRAPMGTPDGAGLGKFYFEEGK